MPLVVGVTFRRVGKVYYFDPGELDLHEGDFVIAETARGVEFGEVAIEPRAIPDEELVAPLKRVVRLATGDDINMEAGNRDRERNAFEVCERKIAQHGLPMKLLEAEYAFDGSQVTFSFSAEGRIDFRELVKDVAGTLRTKVQLHQIGVRDEAKLIGGYGTCGRSLCCSTFLSSFEPISMKMAKDQSLFLNPAKFSGACGKLMCCLRYEHELYKSAHKRLPAVGAILQLPQGRAKVVDVNIVSSVVTLQTEEDLQLHVPSSQLDLIGLCRKHGIACNMSESNCQPLLGSDDAADAVAQQDSDAALDDAMEEPGGDLEIAGPISDVPTQDEPSAPDVAMVNRWRTPGSTSGPDQPRDQSRQPAGGNRPRPRNSRSNGRRSGGRPGREGGRGRSGDGGQ